MSKAVVKIGYNEFVMDINDAVTLMEIMSKAENFKVKRDYTDNANTTAYYVWEQEPTNRDNVTISLMPDAVYRVAKLAGKPDNG